MRSVLGNVVRVGLAWSVVSVGGCSGTSDRENAPAESYAALEQVQAAATSSDVRIVDSRMRMANNYGRILASGKTPSGYKLQSLKWTLTKGTTKASGGYATTALEWFWATLDKVKASTGYQLGFQRGSDFAENGRTRR